MQLYHDPSGCQFGQPTTSPSTVRCRASGRSGVSQHHEKHACRIPSLDGVSDSGGEPDDRAGRRLHGRASDGHVERSGEYEDKGVERGRVLSEALAGVERKQGDRATRCLGEDPACDASRGWPDERLEAARLSGG